MFGADALKERVPAGCPPRAKSGWVSGWLGFNDMNESPCCRQEGLILSSEKQTASTAASVFFCSDSLFSCICSDIISRYLSTVIKIYPILPNHHRRYRDHRQRAAAAESGRQSYSTHRPFSQPFISLKQRGD